MKKYEQDLERSAKAALLSCLAEVPFLKIIDEQSDFREGDIQADLAVKIRTPDRMRRIIAEVKGSGQPRLAREAVNQLLWYKERTSDGYFVFIAPFISSKAADICRSEGIGYVDLSGNCLLSFDTIYINKEGNPNKYPENRELKSLYSPKAERILRVLLCNPGRKWKIKELADESEVSLGQASNVRKMLLDREFVSGERGGFRVIQPAQLLKEWAENYDYRRNRIQEYYSLKNVTGIESAMTAYCNSNNIQYALTGFSGAARVAPGTRYNKAMIYASDFMGKDVSELLLKEVKSGGNLLLFTPYDDGVFYGISRIDDMQIASEIQLYLDLQGYRGRGDETAQVLFERIMEKKW